MKNAFLILMLFIQTLVMKGQQFYSNNTVLLPDQEHKTKAPESQHFGQPGTLAEEDRRLKLKSCHLFSDKTNREEDILKEYLESGKILVHPDDFGLSLQFGQAGKGNFDPVEYIYRLEGFSPNWFNGKESNLDFVSLPYGDFTLAVRAKNPDGSFSKQALQIPISVLRPFYLEAWFLGVLGGAICGGLLLFLSYWNLSIQKRKPRQRLPLAEKLPLAMRHTTAVTLPETSILPNASSDSANWLKQLESASLAHISDYDFTVSQLAKIMLMGESKFYRQVQALTGLTPNEYLKEMRLTQARRLLEQHHVVSVKELASSIGMKDVKYFSRTFKQRFGNSPSEFA